MLLALAIITKENATQLQVVWLVDLTPDWRSHGISGDFASMLAYTVTWRAAEHFTFTYGTSCDCRYELQTCNLSYYAHCTSLFDLTILDL